MTSDIAKRLLIGGFIFAGAFLLLTLYFPSSPEDVRDQTQGRAAIGGPFTLVDHTGVTVTDRDFRGRTMLVFFGFTNCPDICPLTLQKITDALAEFPEGQTADVVPVLITVDPARDTPEVMAEYVSYFHPNTVGLTGTDAQIAAVADAYRIFYNRVDLENGEYTMDHSGFTYVMGTDGLYKTHFSSNAEVEEVIEKLAEVL